MPFGRLIKRYPCGLLSFSLLILFCFYYLIIYGTSKNEKNSVNLKQVLAAAIYAAKGGGIEVYQHSQKFKVKSKGKTKEGAEQYVTEADFKSHCVMYSILKDLFPKIEVISEESVSSEECPKTEFHSFSLLEPLIKSELRDLPEDVYVPAEDITIWIDPLDATQEFTEHLTQYVTTMVCVAVNGLPVIGTIHKPFESSTSGNLGKTYWAWLPFVMSRDLNTYLENLPKMDLQNPNIIISRSHAGAIANKLEHNIFLKKNITPAGGAGYKVLELIKGHATVYLHITKIKKWDICAGDAILKAAGGQMTTLTNKLIDYSSKAGEVNDEGILASITDHDKFYEIFKEILVPM